MRKSAYTMYGQDVSGYRFGEYLAIRDTLPPRKQPRDRKLCEEIGRWVLEHLPTSMILARGHRHADLVLLVAGHLDDAAHAMLDSPDIAEVCRVIKEQLPVWYSALKVHSDKTKAAESVDNSR